MFRLDHIVGTALDGTYRVERVLGRGGMGAVFLATHLGTGRPVAVKVIVPKHAGEAEFLERFRREARAAGRVRHRNVIYVTDFGVAELEGHAIPYLVMEHLDGCSLHEALKEHARLPLDVAVEILDQVCLGVGELHARGIVHRDLKPSNVWIEPDLRGGFRAIVLDFGLAKIYDEGAAADPRSAGPAAGTGGGPARGAPDDTGSSPSDAPTVLPAARPGTAARRAAADPDDESDFETHAGAVLGTPAYMSPEQRSGALAGPASDIYAVGLLAYRMLAGSLPGEGPGPEALHARCPAVPGAVSDVVMSALCEAPAGRPASPELFAAALRANAESAFSTLRRGVGLAVAHAPSILEIGLVLLLPMAAASAAEIAVEALRVYGVTPRGATDLAAQAIYLVKVVLALVAATLMRPVTMLLMVQAMTAPHVPVRPRLALASLLRALVPSLQGAAVWGLVVVAPIALAVWCALVAADLVGFALTPTAGRPAQDVLAVHLTAGAGLGAAAAVLFATAFKYTCDVLQLPNVILAEGLAWRPALARSRALARRTRGDTRLVAALTITLPFLPWAFVGWATSLRGSLAGVLFVVVGELALRAVLQGLNSALTGVLYVKLRLAGGEPIRGLLDLQYLREPPRLFRWQRPAGGGTTGTE